MVMMVLSSLMYKIVLLDYMLMVMLITMMFMSGVLLLYLVSLMDTSSSWMSVSMNNTTQSAGMWVWMGLCCLLSPWTDSVSSVSDESKMSDSMNETMGMVMYSLNSMLLMGGLMMMSMSMLLSTLVNK